MIDALNNSSVILIDKAKYTEAFEQYLEIVKISKQMKDTIALATAYHNMGKIKKLKGKLVEALTYNIKALKEYEKAKLDKSICTSLNNIANIYALAGYKELALKYYFRSLKIAKRTNFKHMEAMTLGNIGGVYGDAFQVNKSIHDKNLALKYYYKAENTYHKIGNLVNKSYVLRNIGDIHFQEKEYSKAMSYYQTSKTISEQCGQTIATIASLKKIGEVYLLLQDIDNALYYTNKADSIASSIEDIENLAEISYTLANIYDKKNNYKLANSKWKDYFKYLSINDSIKITDRLRASAFEYEMAKKDQDNKLLKLSNDQQTSKQKFLYFTIGTLSILAITILLAFIILRKRKIFIDLQNKKLEEQKKEISIQNEELNLHKNKLEDLVEQKVNELKLAFQKVEASDRLKSEFLRNINHEVLTPLNAIVGFTQILELDGIEKEDREKYVKIIIEKSFAIQSIIGDILDFSKVITYNIDFSCSNISTLGFIRNVEKLNSRLGNHIPIYFDYDKDLEEFIYVDENKLYKIFDKIVENALKFTSQGSVTIGIILDQPNKLIFYIRDTGIGIPDEKKDLIFGAFNQADGSLNRSHEGIGIGLALSKAYVDNMSGEIWFESEEGKGTTFFISFPKVNSPQ